MRMWKQRRLSVLLALTLVIGCLAGTGVTVKAADIPSIFGVTVAPNELPSTGGDIKVTVTGEALGEKVWYRVRPQVGDKQYGDSIVTDGDKKYTEAAVTDGSKSEFTVTVPANAESSDVTYQIQVKEGAEPVSAWTGATAKTFIIKASTGEEPGPVQGYKSITVKTADAEGQAVTENISLTIAAGEPSEADKYAVNETGEITYTVTKEEAAEYTIKLHEEVTGYTADPIKFTTNEKGEITNVGDAAYEGQPVTMTLTKKTVEPDPEEKPAVITAVQASPAEVPAEGGTIQLTVTGTNLTETNWGITSEGYISGMDVAASKAGKAEIKEITSVTETGAAATVEVSANGVKNDVDIKISAGPKSGDQITKQAETTILQKRKDYETKTMNPESVVLADDSTIVVTFPEEVSDIAAAKEGAELKALIYIADSNGGNRHDLTEADTVQVGDKKVVIQSAEPLKELLSATSLLYIKERALKTTADEKEYILTDIKWTIQRTARISTITLDKNLFDSKGGTVTATLSGYKVNEIQDDALEASVYIPGQTSAVKTIEVRKSRDENGRPTLTFDVPANTTENTQSYWLNVKHNGAAVYGSAVNDRGYRAAVSVLPEGKTDKDVTLSAVTISGNNKTEVDNTQDIEVNVSNNIGELKTEIRVYGTNLDSKLTKVRAVDENGVVWPVYQISECDGTWRFIAIAGPHRNGVFGDGNYQLIELLPPRYAGTNKTYKIQVSLDGENFIEEPNVSLKINNEGIKGESEFRDCTSANFKYVTVNYVDEAGKKIAESDTYKGYCISMPEGFGIAPKSIEGYELVKEPEFDEWVDEGRTYNYVYKSTSKPQTKVSSITLSGISHQIAAGRKVTLSAKVLPANASNKKLSWKSSNTNVATVTQAGVVTVKKNTGGKSVTITASATDGSGKKAAYKITSMKGVVSKIALSGVSKKIAAGKQIKLTAKVTASKNANKKLSWKSSNTKIATVTQTGMVTIKKNTGGKSVTITASATDGSGKKAIYKITSMKGVVKKVAISGKKSVKAGKTLKLKAKVTASKNANTKVTWTTSNKKYAAVSSTGIVKAKKAGRGRKVTITAKATDGSGKKASVKISIKK